MKQMTNVPYIRKRQAGRRNKSESPKADWRISGFRLMCALQKEWACPAKCAPNRASLRLRAFGFAPRRPAAGGRGTEGDDLENRIEKIKTLWLVK